MRKQWAIRLSLVACVAVWVTLAGSARAQTTYTWTNYANATPQAAVEESWADAANWDGNGVFVSNAANALVFFADISTSLEVEGTLIITNVPTLSLNTLTLNGRGPKLYSTTIVIGDNTSTWTIGDGTTSLVNMNALVWSEQRDVPYFVAPNLTLNQATTTFTGNGDSRRFTFSGNITESGAGYGITKSGSSVLAFSGTNTYTGPTAVNGGVLVLDSASALPGGLGVTGGTSALTFNGGVLEVSGLAFKRGLGTGSHQFQISGGSSGFGAKGAPALVVVGDDAATELQFGSANFSPSALQLNTAAANSGLVALDDSYLSAQVKLPNNIDLNGATRTISVGSGRAVIPGNIRDTSGSGGLTLLGDTLVLSGANTYTGVTTIAGGTLSVDATENLGDASANLVFSGGTLKVTGTSLSSFSGLGHTVAYAANQNVGLDIDDPGHTFTVDQALTQGSGRLLKYGAGTLIVNQANTYTGYTYLYDGTLVLDYTSEDNAKLSANRLYLNGGELVLRGGTYGESVDGTYLGGTTASAISRDGAGAASTIDLKAISSGIWALRISEDAIAKTSTTTANDILKLGYVTVGSDFATKSGSDIVAYSGYTTYADGGGGGNFTTVSEWTGGGSLGSGLDSYVLRISNTGNSDVLDIGANDIQVANYGTILYAGGFDNNFTINGTGRVYTQSTSRHLQMNIYTGTLTVNSLMVHNQALYKSGAGTLVAGGSNDYYERTYVMEGVLRLANDNGAGTTGGGIIVANGAALELTSNITVGAEALSITGRGVSNGGALRNLDGNNTYGGKITVSGSGRINSDSGTLTLGGDVLAPAQDLTFGGAGSIIISNALVKAGGVTKEGAGTLGIVIDDSSSTQWVCGDTTLNDSTLQFIFNDTPSATEPVIKVIGDLAFAAAPTIDVAIDGGVSLGGVEYPLVVVSGDAPSTVPTLTGNSGRSLAWSGSNNKTLVLAPPCTGTMFIFW